MHKIKMYKCVNFMHKCIKNKCVQFFKTLHTLQSLENTRFQTKVCRVCIVFSHSFIIIKNNKENFSIQESFREKPYILYTALENTGFNPTQNPTQTIHKPYTKPYIPYKQLYNVRKFTKTFNLFYKLLDNIFTVIYNIIAKYFILCVQCVQFKMNNYT